ncbi:MAG: redoxin domain-containing protein [Deltaproteobacteria bacterium]|nr:redoxin domain-containing protein [Deltaproteobacteria bacterium]
MKQSTSLLSPLAASFAVLLALASSPAEAEGASAADGLAPGIAAPQFRLPVVNDFSAVQKVGEAAKPVKRWGPGDWSGATPTEVKKLVVMSFFATYCDPCKKEMPELARLYDAYKDQGLGIMLVSIDKGDEQKNEILALAAKSNVKFPVMHDRFQVVARRYAAERLPYLLMLDNAGTIKTVHIGYTDEVKANLENEIRAGLGLEPLPPQAPAKDPAGKPAKGGDAKKGKT